MREVSGGRVPPTVAVPVVLALGLVVSILMTIQALDVGRQLGSGFGPGLIASILTFGGIGFGMTSVIATHIWSGTTRRERDQLAILPLGARQLAILAGVPALLPTVVAMVAATPSIVALMVTTRMPLLSLVGALALGFAVPVALAVVWTVPMLVLRPRRDLVVVVLVSVSLGALVGHAFWSAGRAEAVGGPGVANPVLWVLRKPDQYSTVQTATCVAAWAVATAALLWLRARRRTQAPRVRRSAAQVSTSAPRSLTGLRVWGGLVRIIWRQSSLVSELGVAGLLGSGVCFLAAVLLNQGRDVHGTTALFVAVGFCALPLLGVRSALGPTSRLTQLGLDAKDIRVGIAAAGLLFFLIPLMPGFTLLVWRAVEPRHLAALLGLATIAFAVVLSCGSVLRRITATSLGRTVGVGLSMAAFLGLLRLGVSTWPLTGILAGAAVAAVALAVVLCFSVTQRQVT